MSFHAPADVATFAAEKMQKVNLYESPRLFCDVYALEPGQSQKAHSHADNDKVYAVLTGSVRVDVGAESRVLGPGEVAVAPAGDDHAVHNESDARATLLVVMAPHPSYGG